MFPSHPPRQPRSARPVPARTGARPGLAAVSALAAAALAVTALAGCSAPSATESAPASAPAQAQAAPNPADPPAAAGDERPPVSETLHPALITPETFTRVTTRAERHDNRPVTVTRAQPEGGPDSGGEHVTTVVGETGTLFGYTRQTAGFGAGELPSPDEAERIALAFLAEVDPGYAAGLTVQWVDRHDETIVTGDGAETDVSGMKVKTRHDSGLYAWVIVGAGTEIVTYERDIRWDPSNARRHTAMWLHDAWIAARDAGGDELGGMHAPLDS